MDLQQKNNQESSALENAASVLPEPTGVLLPTDTHVLDAPSPNNVEQESTARKAARLLLGSMLMVTGTTHITVARRPFKAQVPNWAVKLSPYSKDDIVLMSGIAEIALGAALVGLPRERKKLGILAASFFTAIFPGNISQYTERRNALGLDTDTKRFVRLFFQPALVGWALWATGACQKDTAKS